MLLKKRSKKRSIYSYKRYWYHVSTTLKNKYVHLIPWDEDKGFNRGGKEPDGKRICVSPTIEQCITALPYYFGAVCNVYRTKLKVIAKKSKGVFDSSVTKEGWLEDPTPFVKIGILRFTDVENHLKVDNVIEEAGSKASISTSKKVLKWWRKARVKRFIKKA